MSGWLGLVQQGLSPTKTPNFAWRNLRLEGLEVHEPYISSILGS